MVCDVPVSMGTYSSHGAQRPLHGGCLDPRTLLQTPHAGNVWSLTRAACHSHLGPQTGAGALACLPELSSTAIGGRAVSISARRAPERAIPGPCEQGHAACHQMRCLWRLTGISIRKGPDDPNLFAEHTEQPGTMPKLRHNATPREVHLWEQTWPMSPLLQDIGGDLSSLCPATTLAGMAFS